MSHFIVEYRKEGNYAIETITGVEDIDVSQYSPLIGLWVCETEAEVKAMEKELRSFRHVKRSSQQS
jgi:hypothetical protein